jgi:hypothetical protein
MGAMAGLNDIVDANLVDQAGQLRDIFGRSQPFRHICIDGFLTRSAANQAWADFPSFKVENAVNEFGAVGGKAAERNLSKVSPFYKDLYECFLSAPFLNLMSDITGIPELLPDPKLFGGGTHENRDGQELDPHVDFNRMEDLSAYRRLNLLIYLNPEWKAEWGGSIELHSDPRHPEHNQIKAFEPIFNRAVVFETNEVSWHGFPKIRLPADKKHLSRKSISIYLYTKDRPAEEIVAPHATFYVQRPAPDFMVAGHTLTQGDVEDLKVALARRDKWIEHYQAKELNLTGQVDRGQKFLQEVLKRLRVPITGYGLQAGAQTGMYHDMWVGPAMEVTVEPNRPVTRLALHGWMPADMPADGHVTLTVGDRVATTASGPGPFVVGVDFAEATSSPRRIAVNSNRWVKPEGPQGRELTFVLREIELTHPA